MLSLCKSYSWFYDEEKYYDKCVIYKVRQNHTDLDWRYSCFEKPFSPWPRYFFNNNKEYEAFKAYKIKYE